MKCPNCGHVWNERKSKPQLTSIETEAIIHRYRNGERIYKIAECFEISNGWVCQLARRAGLPFRKPHRARAKNDRTCPSKRP